MADFGDAPAMELERSCSLTAVALSARRARVCGWLREPIATSLEFECRLCLRAVPPHRPIVDANNDHVRGGSTVLAIERASTKLPAERTIRT